MRYGVLGGTFDPPHLGHLELARTVLHALSLDEVAFVPAKKNPLKEESATPARHRLRMVELTVQGEQGLAVSDVETTRPGPSYAVETLQELKLVRPGEYWFLCGADSLRDLPRWKDPERLLSLCRLAVVAREHTEPDAVLASLPRDFSLRSDVVPMPLAHVSSSKIREDIERGIPVQQWLKPAVWEYIQAVGLYREQEARLGG